MSDWRLLWVSEISALSRADATELIHPLLCQVLELMELHPLRNSLVGMPGVSGLSVEQRKRL